LQESELALNKRGENCWLGPSDHAVGIWFEKKEKNGKQIMKNYFIFIFLPVNNFMAKLLGVLLTHTRQN
jgi:hypothetical protein